MAGVGGDRDVGDKWNGKFGLVNREKCVHENFVNRYCCIIIIYSRCN